MVFGVICPNIVTSLDVYDSKLSGVHCSIKMEINPVKFGLPTPPPPGPPHISLVLLKNCHPNSLMIPIELYTLNLKAG